MSEEIKKVKVLLKQFICFLIIYETYTICWAYLFVYVEECLGQGNRNTFDERWGKFLHHLEEMDELSIEEKTKLANISSKYFKSKKKSSSCNYGFRNMLKWWEFAKVTCTTIGLYFNLLLIDTAKQAPAVIVKLNSSE